MRVVDFLIVDHIYTTKNEHTGWLCDSYEKLETATELFTSCSATHKLTCVYTTPPHNYNFQDTTLAAIHTLL